MFSNINPIDCRCDRFLRVPHAQVLTADSDTVTTAGARIHLSGASDFKLTSTPSITAGDVVGQEIQLVNTGTKLITLQGAALAGSTLKLRSRAVSLAPGCSVSVVWDGTNWVEVARATYGAATEHHVGDFGAVGDSTSHDAVGTDDTLAIQRAIDAASIDGLPVVFEPGLYYRTTAELLVGADKIVRIKGGGKFVGGLRGTGVGPRAVIAVVGGTLHLSDVAIYAGREYQNGVYIESASGSVVERCRIYQPTIDGLIIINSASCRVIDVIIEFCGKLFHTAAYAGGMPANIRVLRTGTVAKTASTATTPCVITGTGFALGEGFLSTGARQGDFISTHPTGAGSVTAEWLTIQSVDSDTQITCTRHPGSAEAASGLDYTIHVGDGYHEGSRRDCNNHMLNGVFTRNIAGCGVSIRGMYGPSVTNLQSDACGAYPVCVASNLEPSIGSTFRKCYFELNSAADNFFLGYAADVLIDQVNGRGEPVISNPGFVWGVIRGMQDATDPGRIDPLGTNPVDYVPSGVIAADVLAKGRIRSQNYAENGLGRGSLTMSDTLAPRWAIREGIVLPAAWAAVSGVEPPQGGADPNAVAFDFNTATAVVAGATKYLVRWRNNGVVKAAMGFEGDLISPSTDTSGSPGDAVISKPSGRFAMAAGAAAVTITNALVNPHTKVFWSKQQNDATAVDFKVVVGNGSFTVTGAANATGNVVFDFFIVQPS